MPVKPLVPESVAIWSARIAVAVALLCGVLALLSGIAANRFFFGATASTLLLAGAGALLYAIWVVLLQLYFFGIRQRAL
jgi:hypothetical protein